MKRVHNDPGPEKPALRPNGQHKNEQIIIDSARDQPLIIDEHPYLFRTCPHHSATPEVSNPGPAGKHEIWKFALETSAASAYFDSIVIDNKEYLDGGVGINNPVPSQRVDSDDYLANGRAQADIGFGRIEEAGPIGQDLEPGDYGKGSKGSKWKWRNRGTETVVWKIRR
jgi:hypothetical protein